MAKVNCLHFLIKNTESRNPVSRRTGKEITISKADAAKELIKVRDELRKAPDAATLQKRFREVTVARSDCSSFKCVVFISATKPTCLVTDCIFALESSAPCRHHFSVVRLPACLPLQALRLGWPSQ